uniref:response regulator transcription factor n=1 Tax=Bifidobacterium rousetti TaxID=2045439 RepID=UPI0037C17DCE
MDWTIEGLTAKEVAEKMALSEPTVKTHIRHAIDKLQVRNKFQAIRVWSEMRRNG